MDGSVFEENSSPEMLGLMFSSKLDWGFYIISIAKSASKKIGALIHSMKFLSPEVALYPYKSTIHPCMKFSCHVWAAAPRCFLELLYRLQKWICRTVGPSLAASLKQLAHHSNVVISIGITLIDVHQSRFNWFHFFILKEGLLVILIVRMIFLSPFIDIMRM